MACKVIVLFDGYSRIIDKMTMEANCSCVLIKGPKNVIIDTMTAWDKERLLKALEKENIHPDKIDYVVCSHSHSDHTGNNNLFTEAQHILGNCVQRKTTFCDKEISEKGYQICEGIKIVSTPGHTAEDITVLVNGEINGEEAVVAVTGDLFEKEEDITDPALWMDVGVTDLRVQQRCSRSKIANIADIIIPGHGPPFRVTEAIRRMLETQMEERSSTEEDN